MNLEGDDEFYDNAIDHKCVLENMMSSPGYISNELINNPISFDKLVNCINRSKNGKHPESIYSQMKFFKHTVDISLYRYSTIVIIQLLQIWAVIFTNALMFCKCSITIIKIEHIIILSAIHFLQYRWFTVGPPSMMLAQQ